MHRAITRGAVIIKYLLLAIVLVVGTPAAATGSPWPPPHWDMGYPRSPGALDAVGIEPVWGASPDIRNPSVFLHGAGWVWSTDRSPWNLAAELGEAGMAPLAGPVVAGAVILPQNYKLRGLNDSKKILDPEKRDELAQQIKQDALCWSAGIAEVEEIDKINIYHAGLLAMQRAVQGLTSQPDFILVDARRIPNCQTPQRGIIRGDALSASIAAASIIAKTTRDAHML